jgi:hypothetical protein
MQNLIAAERLSFSPFVPAFNSGNRPRSVLRLHRSRLNRLAGTSLAQSNGDLCGEVVTECASLISASSLHCS